MRWINKWGLGWNILSHLNQKLCCVYLRQRRCFAVQHSLKGRAVDAVLCGSRKELWAHALVMTCRVAQLLPASSSAHCLCYSQCRQRCMGALGILKGCILQCCFQLTYACLPQVHWKRERLSVAYIVCVEVVVDTLGTVVSSVSLDVAFRGQFLFFELN